MKEIMDTGLVEGHIFLAEFLYMRGEELQHVLLAVIGLFAERLVRQYADAAVTLEGTLADLEQHAQVLVVEKADAPRRGGLPFLCLHRQQQFVLAVETVEDLPYPALEIVPGKQLHVSRPPSFGLLVAARAYCKVAEQVVNGFFLAFDRAVLQKPPHFGKAVTAAAAHHDVLDAVVFPHALQGTQAHAQQPGGLGAVEQPVLCLRLLLPFPFLP